MVIRILSILLFQLLILNLPAQDKNQKIPDRQDTLKGSNTPERAWFDVLHYAIQFHPDFRTKTISGRNRIRYRVLSSRDTCNMQIDLQRPLQIDSVIQHKRKLDFHRDGNAWFIRKVSRSVNNVQELEIYYSGVPKQSVNAPYDGGIVWGLDALHRPWITAACQLSGASVWYPCKDLQSDEPDMGVTLDIITPDSMVAIGNGRLKNKTVLTGGRTQFSWEVVSPVNAYGVSFYIGKYVSHSYHYAGEKGLLDMTLWVLDYNRDKATAYLKEEVNKTMKTFEHWFGPYPFYTDGFQMIESPYIGMEHQSAIAYGNGFKWGRLKFKNLNEWDLKTDRLVVHEMAHEWFGNSITSMDFTERWIHEGFAALAEELYIDQQYGSRAARDFFAARSARGVDGKEPLIRRYGIFEDAADDMYMRGWVLLHIIRQLTGHDEHFRRMLRSLNERFRHQVVSSPQLEEFIAGHTGVEAKELFRQFLYSTNIPKMEYAVNGEKLSFRFIDCIPTFRLPVRLIYPQEITIRPNSEWQTIRVPSLRTADSIAISSDYYFKLIRKPNRSVPAGN